MNRLQTILTTLVETQTRKMDKFDWENAGQERTRCSLSPSTIFISFLFGYFLLGVLWFHFIEDMNLIDSIYTIIIIVTTVGYGLDSILETERTQIFLIFFVILGVALIAESLSYGITIFLTRMLKEEQQVFYRENADVYIQSEEMGTSQLKQYLEDILAHPYTHYLVWIVWLFGGAHIIGDVEGWTFVQSTYFAVVSGSTVGFGDFTPEKENARVLVIFYLPILILLTALVFSNLFSAALDAFVDQSMLEMQQFQDGVRELLDDKNFASNIQRMDVDQDGKLSQTEFMLQSILNEYGVPPAKLLFLKEQFNRLDVDRSGFVTVEDFTSVAVEA